MFLIPRQQVKPLLGRRALTSPSLIKVENKPMSHKLVIKEQSIIEKTNIEEEDNVLNTLGVFIAIPLVLLGAFCSLGACILIAHYFYLALDWLAD